MNATLISRAPTGFPAAQKRTDCFAFTRASTLILIALFAILPVGPIAWSQVVEFQIDPARSTLRLVPATFDGFFVVSGTKITDLGGVIQQEPQSLIANLSGSLIGTLSGGVFSISANSVVDALENPVGPFPPDSTLTGSFADVDVFGALVVTNFFVMETEAVIAVRDFSARALDGALTIGAPANSLTVEVIGGVLDVDDADPEDYFLSLPDLLVPGDNQSSQPVTGNFNNEITIPFSLEYAFQFDNLNDSLVSLTGTIVATRVNTAIPGDFDGNRIVNGADLTRWRGDFGIDGMSDADGDGDSDGRDFLIWQRNVGRTSATAAAAPVPEPTAWLLGVSGLLALVANARSKFSW